jgi:hypothetical protein
MGRNRGSRPDDHQHEKDKCRQEDLIEREQGSHDGRKAGEDNPHRHQVTDDGGQGEQEVAGELHGVFLPFGHQSTFPLDPAVAFFLKQLGFHAAVLPPCEAVA